MSKLAASLVTRESVTEAIDRAWGEVSALCKPGGRRWTMSVPAEPDRDSDLVIGNALDKAKTVVDAGLAVLAATDALRDARNGMGHPGRPHNRDLHFAYDGPMQIYDAVGDCSACGGAEYGTEDGLHRAIGQLRAALGQERKPWEAE